MFGKIRQFINELLDLIEEVRSTAVILFNDFKEIKDLIKELVEGLKKKDE